MSISTQRGLAHRPRLLVGQWPKPRNCIEALSLSPTSIPPLFGQGQTELEPPKKTQEKDID